MQRSAPRSMKIASPPWTRGNLRGFRSGSSGQPSHPSTPPHHDNPLKASRPLSFRLLSPSGKGDFQGSETAAISQPPSLVSPNSPSASDEYECDARGKPSKDLPKVASRLSPDCLKH